MFRMQCGVHAVIGLRKWPVIVFPLMGSFVRASQNLSPLAFRRDRELSIASGLVSAGGHGAEIEGKTDFQE